MDSILLVQFASQLIYHSYLETKKKKKTHSLTQSCSEHNESKPYNSLTHASTSLRYLYISWQIIVRSESYDMDRAKGKYTSKYRTAGLSQLSHNHVNRFFFFFCFASIM